MPSAPPYVLQGLGSLLAHGNIGSLLVIQVGASAIRRQDHSPLSGRYQPIHILTRGIDESVQLIPRPVVSPPVDIEANRPEIGWMQKNMRTLVSRLTCAEMTRRICACDIANREWSNWSFDVSRINTPETYQASLDVLNNPLGTRRGHIYAWQQIKGLARVVGMLA